MYSHRNSFDQPHTKLFSENGKKNSKKVINCHLIYLEYNNKINNVHIYFFIVIIEDEHVDARAHMLKKKLCQMEPCQMYPKM